MNTDLLLKKIDLLKMRPHANQSAIEAIKQWLLSSDKLDRIRINPYHIVHSFGFGAQAIIPDMLHGVLVGLFDLFWDVRCPHCNMITCEYNDLSKATSRSYCPMCEKEFESDFANSVEVTFSLNREIEDLNTYPPCPPPPSLNAHFIMIVPYQQTKIAEDTLSSGAYRYVCPITQSKGVLTVTKEKSDELQVFRIKQLSGPFFEPATISAHSGKIRFEVTNNGHPISGFWVTALNLPTLAPQDIPLRLSGLELIHYPEFRKLFGDQVLSNRERLRIAAVTTVFTDITGSTRMYEELGDTVAYNIVRDHFEILFKAIETHSGMVLKTIGDAIMASFINNAQALKSIIKALADFKEYNKIRNLEEQVNIKVGMHRGAAILVNLNDRLDYFGSNINKAARIQGQANSNEIAFSQGIYEDEICQRVFKEAKVKKIIKQVVNLKGIKGEQPLYKAIVV